MLFLSKDALHRVPLCNAKALKKVLGIGFGRISFGIMASTTQGMGRV
jgi:hypothetical protein